MREKKMEKKKGRKERTILTDDPERKERERKESRKREKRK